MGLVRREEASEERRGAYAVLTQAGAIRLKQALATHVAFVRRHFLSLFSEGELTQMGEFWRRVDAHKSRSAEPA